MIQLSIQSIKPYLQDEFLFEQKFNTLNSLRKDKITALKKREDQCRSLAAGVLLQNALEKAGIDDRSVQFQVNEHGKMSIAEYSDFYFNLSHSGDYAVCAVADQPVGIDIEKIRGRKEAQLQRLIRHVCTEEEKERLMCFDGERLEEEFVRIWTKKESYTKAMGMGLQIPFHEVNTLQQGFYYLNETLEGYMICAATIESKTCICQEQMVTSIGRRNAECMTN